MVKLKYRTNIALSNYVGKSCENTLYNKSMGKCGPTKTYIMGVI